MNFNIITGQVVIKYPLNSISRRFNATQLYRTKEYSQNKSSQLPQVRKLGKSKDSKAFSYNYNDNRCFQTNGTISLQTLQPQKKENQANIKSSLINKYPQKISLTNATKNYYNIISHTIQKATTKAEWSKTHKQNPISKFIHQGRLHAANHSNQYLSKFGNNPNIFSKNKNMCSGICKIQKSYGVQKFFRKYK